MLLYAALLLRLSRSLYWILSGPGPEEVKGVPPIVPMSIVEAISGEPVKVFLLFQQEWPPCIDSITGVENLVCKCSWNALNGFFPMVLEVWHLQVAAHSPCTHRREENSLHLLLTSWRLLRSWNELGNNGRPGSALQSRSHSQILPSQNENKWLNWWQSIWTWPVTSFPPAGVICVMWISHYCPAEFVDVQ